MRENRIKIDFESENKIYFTVETKEKHSVIYDKMTKKFICDCKYFSLKSRECSHILAAKMFLESKKNKD